MDTSKLIFKIPYPDRAVFSYQPARLILDSFVQAVENGLSVEEATAYVLLDFKNMLEDESYAALAYIALAALQIACEDLQTSTRAKALHYLEDQRYLAVWLDTTLMERVMLRQAFDSIKQKLSDAKLT